MVAHSERPEIRSRTLLYLTIPIAAGLPAVHRLAERAALGGAIAAGAERTGFRLVRFGAGPGRLHFVAEARSTRALSKGMQGLLVRASRALNRHWGRSGTVFGDRYDARNAGEHRVLREALARTAPVREGARSGRGGASWPSRPPR